MEAGVIPDTIDPTRRTAAAPTSPQDGPVTLINCFVVVDADRAAAFTALWAQTSAYFRVKPGFLGPRPHRAVSSTAHTAMST